MLSRRVFVGAGATVAAWAASPTYALELWESSTKTLPIRAVFDRTFAEGVAFGAAAARRGALVNAVGADLGSFWMNTLEPLLREGPLTLAGLTAGAPLFCLELLCRDYGLRTVYRIEHVPAGNGRVQHVLTCDRARAAWADRLVSAGADWPIVAADLTTVALGRGQPAPPIELLDLRAHERSAQSLFTWMIAPAPISVA